MWHPILLAPKGRPISMANDDWTLSEYGYRESAPEWVTQFSELPFSIGDDIQYGNVLEEEGNFLFNGFPLPFYFNVGEKQPEDQAAVAVNFTSGDWMVL